MNSRSLGGTLRKRLALAFWAITLVMIFVTINREPVASVTMPPLPAVGDTIDMMAVSTAFQFSAPAATPTWLLVLSSSCEYCLALDLELEVMKREAACQGVTLLPLVVEIEMPIDSIRAVLGAHELEIAGVASNATGLRALGVRVVPALLVLDDGHGLEEASVPTPQGTWPPPSRSSTRPGCVATPSSDEPST